MPHNWKTFKLSDFCQIKYGKDHKKLSDGSIPCYGTGGIMRFVESQLYDDESVLIPRKGSLNNIYYINEPFWTVDTLFWTRINKSIINPKYFFYNLKTHDFASKDVGSAVPSLTTELLKNLELTIPPLPEQTAIANILSALDNKIELNLQMNKTLEEMAMNLYKHWFVDFGPFQNGEFIDSELGQIPKGWEVKTIDQVTSLIIDHRGKTPKKLGGDWSQKDENCYEAISAKNIKSGKIVKPETIKYLDHELFMKWMKDPLENGDVLLTSEAPIGEYYFILGKTDYCLSQRLFGIRSNPEVLIPDLLYCFLSSSYGQQQLNGRASGSTVQGIKQSELRKVILIVPDKISQIKLGSVLRSNFEQMRNNDVENQTLTSLRDTLLPKLISGELRVKDAEQLVTQAL